MGVDFSKAVNMIIKHVTYQISNGKMCDQIKQSISNLTYNFLL